MIDFKKVIRTAAAIVLAAAAAVCPLTAFAEAHGNFYIPDGAVASGDEFTVSVEFTASDTIGTVQADMTYNETYMQFVSGDFANGNGGIIKISGFPDESADSLTVTLTFKALKEGTGQINLINGSVMSPDGESLSNAITAYANITVGPASSDSGDDSDSINSDESSYSDDSEDSSYYADESEYDSYADESSQEEADTSSYSYDLPALLGSLTVDYGELKPAFDPGIYSYTVTVPHEVDVLEVDATTANPNDTIWFEGARYLGDGINTRTITVTSADGAHTNVYTVEVQRLPAEDDSESDSGEDEYGESLTDGTLTAQTDSAQETLSAADKTSTSKKAAISADEEQESGMEELLNNLKPALYTAMAVIVLAMIILIVWIKSKTKKNKK